MAEATGTFVYLALVGDRVLVQRIAIVDSLIRLDLLEHGPQDALHAPSRPTSQFWALLGGRLTRTAAER